MEHKQKITGHSGFTLVEAIVTMIIMLTLMGIILTGTIQARQRFLVRDSAQQFAGVIRQAIADTKNGIKVKDPNCTANTTIPRECSNYKISSTSNIAYDIFVETTGSGGGKYPNPPANYALQGGTAFLGALSLDFIFSSGSFPMVSVAAGGTLPLPTTNGTIQMTIISLSNNDIKTNICIMKGGSVLVQSEDCN